MSGVSATGVILAAVYLLWMYQRVMFGPVTQEKNRGLRDLSAREFWTLAPVVALIIWIGVYPNPFLRKLDLSVSDLMERMNSRTVVSRSAPYGSPDPPPAAPPKASAPEASAPGVAPSGASTIGAATPAEAAR
jgi:hypothetical protein